MTLRTLLGLAAFSVLLPGCEYFGRMSECRKLSRAVSPTLSSIDEERKKGPDSPAAYRDIAARYDQLSRTVAEGFPPGSRAVDIAREYQALFGDAARDARAFADALESKNLLAQVAIRTLAARNTRREAQIVARVSGLCSRR